MFSVLTSFGGGVMRVLRRASDQSFRLAFWSLFIWALLLALGAGVRAQQTAGRIFGTIIDPQGANVPNAQVTITNQDTGATRSVVSGSDGFYNAPEVPAGKYMVAA